MTDQLVNLTQSAQMYGALFTTGASGVSLISTNGIFQYQNASSISVGGHSASYNEMGAVFGYYNATGATLLGTDSNGIGYFHLTGVTAKLSLSQAYTFNVVCSGTYQQSVAQYYNEAGVTDTTVNITDSGGSSTCPSGTRSGQKLFNHTGSPVVAAILLAVSGSTNKWYGFAAGDASALTVTAAQTACGTSGLDPCQSCCDNTAVTITGLT